MAGTTTRPILATYRVQLRNGVDFAAAEGVVPYLAELGVSHVYLSPILTAAAGSTHGYDVVDPTQIDPALGGADGFRSFVAVAHDHALGVVVDIVPNHMAADAERNSWWRSVLRHGRASTFAYTFDITWNPPDRKLDDQILLPVLGDHYGRELEAGRFRLALDSLGATFESRAARDDAVGLGSPPPLGSPHAEGHSAGGASPRKTERIEDELVVRVYETTYPLDPRSAAGLWQRSAGRDRGIEAVLEEVNGDPDQLHEILEQQHYRLARWRTGSEEIDYRRFFDITSLVGVRVEQPDVFHRTHIEIGRWIDDGLVDGLRVDHPDGLADPAAYMHDLRRRATDAPWIVVEKIVERGEQLPPWPVAGTTGYEFATVAGGLLIEPAGYEELRSWFGEHTRQPTDFDEVVRDAKVDALHHELSAELRRLTDRFVDLCEGQPRYRDFARRELHDALVGALSSFPVYRTYVTRDGSSADDDRRAIESAMAHARARRPQTDPELFDVLAGSLLAQVPFDTEAAAELRQRFQQLTGAVMAKGNEDTALYRYPVLLAANEVGGDPAAPARSVEQFHEHCIRTTKEWPAAMLTLSTHDTKRSEDVRARLAVLSEAPESWTTAAGRWSERLAPAWGEMEPDRVMELVLYQTLVGAHPLSLDRAWRYVEKAAREAAQRTTWLRNDERYEAVWRGCVQQVFDDPDFQRELHDLVDDVRSDGWANALVQRLLLLTAPGVPDLYQGSELWALHLVDPDNRAAVNFDRRGRVLGALVPGALHAIDEDGVVKLDLTRRALAVRRRYPDAFLPGSAYEPLVATGPAAKHAVAFRRGDDVITVVSRLHRTRREQHRGWAGSTVELPDGVWDDQLDPSAAHRGEAQLSAVLGERPVALLVRRGAGG